MNRLRVESHAKALAVEVYRVTAGFPLQERYGLAREMRRSAVSVGSNLAEGRGRKSDRELSRYIDIALGSAAELRFQAELANEVRMLSTGDAERIRAMLDGLRSMALRLKRTLR